MSITEGERLSTRQSWASSQEDLYKMPDLNFIKGFQLGPLPDCQEDVFYCTTREFDEVTVEELNLKRARSFKADLLHKLNIMRRAFGSRQEVARELGTNPATIWKWIAGKTWPSKPFIDQIDNSYNLAIEILCQQKRRAAQKRQRKPKLPQLPKILD